MIKRRRFPRIFFGWWTVVISGLVAMWAVGYYGFGFSSLFKPMASELGFSRVVTSVADSISRLSIGLAAPVTGWLTDRFGPKWISLFGVFLIGLSLTLMNFVNSLWAFYIVWGVMLGLGFNMGTMLPVQKAIADWFVKKRGVATGIHWALRGLSGVLVLPLIAWFIITQDWRAACLIGGVVMWLFGLPLIWFFLRQHRPEYYGLLPDGATTVEEATDTGQMIDRGVEYAVEVQEVEFTLRQAMRTPAYWLLILAFGVQALSIHPVTVHSIPFLTDIGIDPLRAAGMLAMTALASIPSRIAGGFIIDRVKKQHLRFVLAATYLLQAVGIIVFLLNRSIAMIYVWFILRGLGMGGAMIMTHPITARYFGRKAFGSIRGFTTMFLIPIGMASPIYLGWVYDTTGSYIDAFTLVAVVLAMTAVLASFILPPKPPAQVTDIRKFV
ncbi:MFS transporter [Chloroflexota bacterium]